MHNAQTFKAPPFLVILCFILFCHSLIGQQIVINEFMASNASTISDNGIFDDWVELYNPSSSPVNIGGMYLTDDLTNPTLWQIPTNSAATTTIPAGGFLVLWFDKEPDQGPLHVNAKLGSAGEDIGLFASDGTTQIDAYTYGPQLVDRSEGRTSNGGNTWTFFTQATPGATNNTAIGGSIAPTPTASQRGGLYSNSISVSLNASAGTIYYTTDGSEPTEASTRYTGAITINTNTPLRARTFNAPDAPSAIMTQTYLINVAHDLPIITYTVDPVQMFDPAIGMYPNFLQDIEINANVELYEIDGTQGFNQLFETEIQGTGSAVYDQKSLAIKAKASLGSDVIPYKVFPDLPFEELRSLVFRNSGQDWNVTMFRDAYASSLVADLSDVGNIIDRPKLYTQGYRPAILYLNGEYWGIHNIRERIDKRYLKTHFNLNDDEVDLLDNLNEVKEGTIDNWDALTTYLENNSLRTQGNFDIVADQVDIEDYLDYIAFNIYIDNHDWPENNNRRWRETATGGKWRWLVKDLDFSLGYFVNNQVNTGIFTANSLRRMLNDNGFQWPASGWSTLLFRRLMNNTQFKTDFVNRMADQLNTLYEPARMNSRINQFVDLYDSEIQEHHDLWSSGFQRWDQHVQKVRGFANGRREVVRNHIVSEIAEVNGTTNVSISLNPSNRGQVELNTINIDAANNNWTGVYFTGVEVPVRAYPNRGYVLDFWSGNLSGNAPNTTINFSGSDNTITANFRKGSTTTQPIVINEINYNSPDNQAAGDWVELHNPNTSAVNIEGWYFEDEGGDFFAIPAGTSIPAGGYLVLVEEETAFTNIHPGVTNYIGAFGLGEKGFGLSGGGELITLKNANGVLIDAVDYDDVAPWPTAADGDGPTLQLISPSLNNALAASWEAKNATPGRANGTSTSGQDQNITFASIPNKTTTSGPFSISATASSGLPVSFAILSGPATISNNTITLLGTAGTVSVRVSQPGNTQWNAAPAVTRTFTITGGGNNNGCDPTFSTTSNSITIGNIDAPHSIVKVFSPSYQTLFSCTDNCTTQETVSGLSPGTHHIDIQLYTASWQPICTVKEDIEITGGNTGPSDQTITFPSIADKTTSDGPFTISATASSGLAVNFTLISGPATISNNTITLTGTAGTVSVRASQAGNAEWNEAPAVTRTFTVYTDGNTACNPTVSTTASSITLNNLNTPHVIAKVFDASWQTIFTCFDDCEVQSVISGLAEGVYHIDIQLYDASWQRQCMLKEDVTLAGGGSGGGGTGTPSCSDVQISFSENNMIIDGLTAAIDIAKVFDENYNSPPLFICNNNCGDRQVIPNVTPQEYHIYIQFLDSSWKSICSDKIDIRYNGFDSSDNNSRLRVQSTPTNMTVYPNPTNGQLYLNVGQRKGSPIQVALFNTLGQTFSHQTFELTGVQEQIIDVSNLTKGIYFLRVLQDGGVVYSEKVVVE